MYLWTLTSFFIPAQQAYANSIRIQPPRLAIRIMGSWWCAMFGFFSHTVLCMWLNFDLIWPEHLLAHIWQNTKRTSYGFSNDFLSCNSSKKNSFFASDPPETLMSTAPLVTMVLILSYYYSPYPAFTFFNSDWLCHSRFAIMHMHFSFR